MAGSRVSALKGFTVPALFLSTQRVTVCVWWMAGGECGGCHLCKRSLPYSLGVGDTCTSTYVPASACMCVHSCCYGVLPTRE